MSARTTFLQRRRGHALVLAALVMTAVFTITLPAGASSSPTGAPAASTPGTPPSRPSAPHSARVLAPLPSTLSTTHYLYAEDGTSPIDGIDVFSISGSTLTSVQNVPVGVANSTYFGSHHLVVTKQVIGRPACLFFLSGGNSTLYGFTIDPATGMLTAAPSAATAPTSFATGDLLASKNVLVETDPSTAFNTFRISNNCSPVALASNPTNGEQDINMARLSTNVVSADFNTGNIVTYSLNQSSGVMSEIHSVPGQIGSPDGVAVQVKSTLSGLVTNVFTGQATFGPPQVQGAQTDATGSVMNFFSGSPATDGDPSSFNGAGVLVSGHLLLQLNNSSNSLGWYNFTTGTPGFPGAISYSGDTGLPSSPTQMAKLGTTLFVASWSTGEVDACHVTSGAVSGCVSVASLSTVGGSFNLSGSVAIK